MNKCFLCSVELTYENNTNEHIIPNAIGGKKKVKGFICKNCNNKTGETWDQELAKQVNFLSLFLNIKRERGTPPSQIFPTISGELIQVHHDGIDLANPKFKKNISENGREIEFNLTARNNKELEGMLQGIKKKYPKINIEELKNKAIMQSSYLSEPINASLSIGGNIAGKSLVKTVVAFLHSNGINANICEHAIEYLRNDGEPCFGYLMHKDYMQNRPEGDPIHIIHIEGNQKNKTIIGYLELFGIYRIIMCLSETFSGNSFQYTYAIDPTTGKEINCFMHLDLTKEEVFSSYSGAFYNTKSTKDAMSKVIGKRVKLANQEEMSRVIEKAVTYAFSKMKEKGEKYITPENSKEMLGFFWEKFDTYAKHIITNKKFE